MAPGIRRAIGLRADEIIVDCFAGGGGASEAIRMVFGRDPDIAINHDAEAICMHRANHPGSFHYNENIWRVDPVKAVADCAKRLGRSVKVGLLWGSPDCTDFSKAKGGKPISRKRRALAHVFVRWARAVRPRVMVGENVEEFEGWGPLITNAQGKLVRDPVRRGRSFRVFVRQLEREGYIVEWRTARACDFGAPTTRRRLFFIARRDRQAIEWPEPTHGDGRELPYRVAAECIDWHLDTPSIFMTAAEAKAYYKATGKRIQRPLKPASMRRIARGTFRFVIDSPDPFIIPIDQLSSGDVGARPTSRPLSTIGTENRHAVVQPHLVPMTHENAPESVGRPLSVVTGQRNKHVLITPFVATVAHGEQDSRGNKRRGKGAGSAQAPLGTIGTTHEFAVVAPTLIQTGYGEDKKRNQGRGQPPRALDIRSPLGTIVEDGKHALVTSFLAKYFGDTGQRPGSKANEPVDTITEADHNALVTAHLQREFGRSVGDNVRRPAPTVTPGGGGKTAIVTSHLLKFHGSSRQGDDLRTPAPTIRSQGNHLAEVRAFLIAYYETDQLMGNPRKPLPTITPKDRFGIVTVHGQDYAIVDIGMRMLTPRERFRAQGFGDHYIIDPLFEYTYERKNKKTGKITRWTKLKPLTDEAQGRMVGNSVSPPHAAAILRTLFGLDREQERAA